MNAALRGSEGSVELGEYRAPCLRPLLWTRLSPACSGPARRSVTAPVSVASPGTSRRDACRLVSRAAAISVPSARLSGALAMYTNQGGVRVVTMAMIDNFMYFNEAAVCTLRLRLLRDVVDRFVVVEGTPQVPRASLVACSFKEMCSLGCSMTPGASQDRLSTCRSVPTSGAGSPWERERYLRDAISTRR